MPRWQKRNQRSKANVTSTWPTVWSVVNILRSDQLLIKSSKLCKSDGAIFRCSLNLDQVLNVHSPQGAIWTERANPLASHWCPKPLGPPLLHPAYLVDFPITTSIYRGCSQKKTLNNLAPFRPCYAATCSHDLRVRLGLPWNCHEIIIRGCPHNGNVYSENMQTWWFANIRHQILEVPIFRRSHLGVFIPQQSAHNWLHSAEEIDVNRCIACGLQIKMVPDLWLTTISLCSHFVRCRWKSNTSQPGIHLSHPSFPQVSLAGKFSASLNGKGEKIRKKWGPLRICSTRKKSCSESKF